MYYEPQTTVRPWAPGLKNAGTSQEPVLGGSSLPFNGGSSLPFNGGWEGFPMGAAMAERSQHTSIVTHSLTVVGGGMPTGGPGPNGNGSPPPGTTGMPGGGDPTFGGTCFTSNTQIILSDGHTKSISDIQVGDEVFTYDTVNKAVIVSNVVKTFVHPDTNGYIKLNERLEVTSNHDLYSGGEWVNAGNLKVGDKIEALYEGEDNYAPLRRCIEITSIEHIDEVVTTYNFEVESEHHNYYAEGFLAHNKSQIYGGPTGGDREPVIDCGRTCPDGSFSFYNCGETPPPCPSESDPTGGGGGKTGGGGPTFGGTPTGGDGTGGGGKDPWGKGPSGGGSPTGTTGGGYPIGGGSNPGGGGTPGGGGGGTTGSGGGTPGGGGGETTTLNPAGIMGSGGTGDDPSIKPNSNKGIMVTTPTTTSTTTPATTTPTSTTTTPTTTLTPINVSIKPVINNTAGERTTQSLIHKQEAVGPALGVYRAGWSRL